MLLCRRSTLVALLSQLLLAVAIKGQSCPFAATTDKPVADSQTPGCSAEKQETQDLQELFNDYCEHYDFKNNSSESVCIKPQNQQLTEQQEFCSFNADSSCIGPLQKLIGRWEGNFGAAWTMLPIYDPIGEAARLAYLVGRVPQQPFTDMHSFNQTYKEVIVFRPIKGDVRNRGVTNADPINAECNQDQSLQGVTYTLTIIQTSEGNPDQPKDGDAGGVIHEENGMYLYNIVPAQGGGTGYEIVKLQSVPHGITVTSLGNYSQISDPSSVKCDLINQQNGAFLDNIQRPFGTCAPDSIYTPGLPDSGGPASLNSFLTDQTEGYASVNDFVHLYFKQHASAATPFVQQQANVVEYAYDMWISSVLNNDGDEEMILQYGQSSAFEFMTRLECLDCEGVTSRDEMECITGCAGFESYIYNGTAANSTVLLTEEERKAALGNVEGTEFIAGRNFNEIPGFLHGQCMSCTPSTSPDRGLAQGVSCAQNSMILWPHNQVNTLRKVSNDDESPADYSGVQCTASPNKTKDAPEAKNNNSEEEEANTNQEVNTNQEANSSARAKRTSIVLVAVISSLWFI